ncbi:hypothetical protein FFIC_281230 [Fructobacillus ficulneus]|uniref:Uncharacterized protein n=1 Tax=Fructobacillus ficulneus TaxID=157463 RepID=A0A0K8MHS7_9LACO|nr:hypothetical protein FFIC_281230 [Fructobacillus ficulneus]
MSRENVVSRPGFAILEVDIGHFDTTASPRLHRYKLRVVFVLIFKTSITNKLVREQHVYKFKTKENGMQWNYINFRLNY